MASNMKYKIGALKDLGHVASTLRELAGDVSLLQDGKRCPEGILQMLLNAQLTLVERAIDRIESNPTRGDDLA